MFVEDSSFAAVLVVVFAVLDVVSVVHLCRGISVGAVVRESEKWLAAAVGRHAPVTTVSSWLELGLPHSS